MSDGTPPGVKFTFLDYIGLAFILPGGEELLRRPRGGWPIWLPALVLGFVALAFRDRSQQLRAWLVAKFRKRPSKLVIHSANYGAVDNTGESYEVGDVLRNAISGDSLVFDVEERNLVIGSTNIVPTNFLPSKEKRLQVTFSYGNEPTHTTDRRQHGRLLLPEDSKIKWLVSEVDRIKKLYLEEGQQRAKLENECAETKNKVLQLEAELSTRPKLSLNVLQIDAIRLSLELTDFRKRLGTPPAPKYTAEQIDNMTTRQMDALARDNDGDFFEACEYYRGGKLAFTPVQLETQLTARWTRLLPFYQKVAGSYALHFKSKVETLHHRFTIEGMADETLLLPVQGAHGIEDIDAISAKLWELAFKVGERGERGSA